MHVVATAGHVDHGKSTLVRALTGMEPDRWAEERRRGMTIDLGFAWTELPTGQTVAFVDVPGHERFVPNMLAGVGPAPAVLMVVAADEGWMPQSGEHLDALNALGVRHGVLVVTRSDLMDPALALADAREHLLGSTLESVDAVCVSGATGAGLDGLRRALGAMVDALPKPDPAADVRLWLDRVFTIRGAGTIVTGTLTAGSLRVGDQLELAADGQLVTVRGLQALGEPHAEAPAVARVAVNLRGVPRAALHRGDALLSPGKWRCTETVDIRLSSPTVSSPNLPTQAVLHIGSAAVAARVRPLGSDTARLTLAHRLPLRIGDRGVLRDPGATWIISGTIVLDTMLTDFTRRGAALDRARVLTRLDGVADGAAELGRRGLVRRSELVAMGAQVPAQAPHRGDWLLDPAAVRALATTLTAAVLAYATAHPLEPGMPLEAARQAVGLPEVRLLEILLDDGAAAGLTAGDGRIRHGSPPLPATVQNAIDEVRDQLAAAPFAAPDADQLAQLGLESTQLGAATRTGQLLKVAEGIYLLPDALAQAARELAELPGPFTVSAAREALATTRRVAVPLLERLAREGLTRRYADGTHQLVAPSG